MEKKQTLDILMAIEVYYPNRGSNIDVKTELEAWHLILKDYEYQQVYENLLAYVKSGERFPPNVGQLVSSANGVQSRAVPSIEETQTMMIGWEQNRAEALPKEDAEPYLAEMRKILGIDRG